jgi:Xaa-Pro aminopeptidase
VDLTSSKVSAWKDIDWRKLTDMNIKRLKPLMKAEGVDALFVHRSDNFQYLTGYMNPTHYNALFYTAYRQCALLLAEEDQSIMLAGAADFWDAKNFWWIDDVRPMPAKYEVWPKILKEALVDHGLTKGKIGLDPHSEYVLIDRLREELGSSYNFVNAQTILEKARAIKNSEEIKVIRRATSLAEAMVVTAKNNIREGVREIDVAIEVERTLSKIEPLAYPAYKPMISSGDRGAYLDRIPSNKIMEYGEIVMIDAGCRYMGYYSEFSRHVMLGKPTAEQKRMYRAAFEAEQEAIKVIKPGVKVSEVDRIARKVIEQAGYKEFQHPHYTGHGHGLSVHDLPIAGDPGQKDDYPFEPGMVVAIEPGIFKPGVGGVREEDVVLVTEASHEILSKVGYEDKLLDG